MQQRIYQLPQPYNIQPQITVNPNSSSNIWQTVFIVLFGLMILIALGFGIYAGAKYIVQSLKSNTENKCDTKVYDLLPDSNCYVKCDVGLQRCDNTSKCCFLDREDCVDGKCQTKCQINNGNQTIRCGNTDICYDPKIEACSIPPDPKNARKCPITKLNKYGECCKTDEVVDVQTGECKKCGPNDVQCEGECCLKDEDCVNGTCCAKNDILNSVSNDKLQLCCKDPLDKCIVDNKNVCCGVGQKCINGKCVRPCGSINCVEGEYCYQDLNGKHSCLKALKNCGKWGPYIYNPPLYDQNTNAASPKDGFRVSYDTDTNNKYYNINSKLNSSTKLRPITIKVDVPEACKDDIYCQLKVAERGSTNIAFNNHTNLDTNTCSASIDPYEELLKDATIKCPLDPFLDQSSCCRNISDSTKFTGKICNGQCWQEKCICQPDDILKKDDGSFDIKSYVDIDGTTRKNCDIILDLEHKCNIGNSHPDAVINWVTGNCLNKVKTCNNNGNVKVNNGVYTGDSAELDACICDEGFGGVNCNKVLKIPDNLINTGDYIKTRIENCNYIYIFAWGCKISNIVNHNKVVNTDGYTIIDDKTILIMNTTIYGLYATFDISKNDIIQNIIVRQPPCFLEAGKTTVDGTNNYQAVDAAYWSTRSGRVIIGLNY